MKKLCSIALAATLALSGSAVFAEGEDVSVYLDGELLEMTDADGNTVTPVIIDGTTYLPVRAISEALELGVTWSEETRSVYLSTENPITAADAKVFGSLGKYVDNPYEILGRKAFLNPLKALVGDDYDDLLLPLLSTCYVSGDDDMITLHCSDRAVVDVYPSGKIEVAVRTDENEDFDGKNVVKYYSEDCPDYVESKGILKFIAQNVGIGDGGCNIIEFVHGSGITSLSEGVYTETNNKGSFTFTKNAEGELKFKGTVNKGDEGNCNTQGTVRSNHGSWLCTENGAPAILFAFSGDYMTIVGLNNVTKVLTSVYER